VEGMRLNAAANGVADSVRVLEYEWGRKVAPLGGPFDVVLVADCICHGAPQCSLPPASYHSSAPCIASL
jgi:hypothetical protein